MDPQQPGKILETHRSANSCVLVPQGSAGVVGAHDVFFRRNLVFTKEHAHNASSASFVDRFSAPLLSRRNHTAISYPYAVVHGFIGRATNIEGVEDLAARAKFSRS